MRTPQTRGGGGLDEAMASRRSSVDPVVSSHATVIVLPLLYLKAGYYFDLLYLDSASLVLGYNNISEVPSFEEGLGVKPASSLSLPGSLKE